MARVLLIESRRADLTIIHDPELVLLAPWIRSPRIWDVHEDLVAQVEDKDWVPGRLQPLARGFARLLEWVAVRVKMNRGPGLCYRTAAELRRELRGAGLTCQEAAASSSVHRGNVLIWGAKPE